MLKIWLPLSGLPHCGVPLPPSHSLSSCLSWSEAGVFLFNSRQFFSTFIFGFSASLPACLPWQRALARAVGINFERVQMESEPAEPHAATTRHGSCSIVRVVAHHLPLCSCACVPGRVPNAPQDRQATTQSLKLKQEQELQQEPALPAACSSWAASTGHRCQLAHTKKRAALAALQFSAIS